MVAGDNLRAVTGGINAGKLRAEKQDLSGIIHPQQRGNQRPGSSVTTADGSAAQVQAQTLSAYQKERHREQCSNPHVTPRDLRIGQVLEDQGKE